ncbi:MAG: HNH endonuclease [Candidatus Zixiibacteriota bacterium]
MERRAWTRGELLIAFSYYCQTSFGQLHKNNPEIIELAKSLNRTPSALAMKLVNFASLDPVQQERNVRGLSNVSAADKRIVQDFAADWTNLVLESERAREKLSRIGTEIHGELPDSTSELNRHEEERLVLVRRVQSFFRRTVLSSYQEQCAMCLLNVPALLTASHIIPWKTDVTRRADPTNGLSLCALHDRAFDRGLITLNEKHCIVVSQELLKDPVCVLHRSAFHQLEGQPLLKPDRFSPDPSTLEFHRRNIYVG